MSSFELVIGTGNAKKLAELRHLMEGHSIQVKALADFEELEEPEETGTTFLENAEIKAVYYAQALDRWVLAEDSGLSVAALDGAPGVYSARYSGEHATDQSNNKLLLEKMAEVPVEQRRAWYTCHIAISDPQGKIHARAEAYCPGQILTAPVGDKGFGYDPLFEIPEYGLTFAQLGVSVKSLLSHRARAYRRILPMLVAITRRQPA